MKTALRIIAGLIGVFAITLQYWVVAAAPNSPPLATWTVNFFSFFTILTNCLAACAMLFPTVAPNSSAGLFFSRPSVRTAIASYIIIVGAVYFFVLRQLWSPEGWARVADQLLHYATPAMFVLDWLLFVSRGRVGWRLADQSLLFPLGYMIWTLLHGAWSNWYPYPFVDVSKLGYPAVFKNFAGLTLVFIVMAAVLIAIDKALARGRADTGDEPALM